MNAYNIVSDPRVKVDLRNAKDYLNSKRNNQGLKFLAEYRKALNDLKQIPFFEQRYKDIHCIPLKKHKYLVHYRIDHNKNQIHILAVLSTHLNPEKNWL